MPLDPNATNRVTCSKCGWSRILDPLRTYRSGHTHPETGAECREMLMYEQLSPLPPEVALLGESSPVISDLELNDLVLNAAGSDGQKARDKAQKERLRRHELRQKVADLYEREDAADIEV